MYIMEKGTAKDINELEKLYDDLNDYLAQGINYPGWMKGIYPVRETAAAGIHTGNLFVLRMDGEIAGSVILSHEPEAAYSQADWLIEADYKDVLVIHTLVVHPKYMKNGIGRKLMAFTEEYGKKQGMKSIRLDVFDGNTPAIALYESCGYKYVKTVDLGLNIPGLVWFRLYELLL